MFLNSNTNIYSAFVNSYLLLFDNYYIYYFIFFYP